jgi:hypothetical protein
MYEERHWKLPKYYRHYYMVGKYVDTNPTVDGNTCLVMEIESLNGDRIGIDAKTALKYE